MALAQELKHSSVLRSLSYGPLFTIAPRSPGPIWRAGVRISEPLALTKSDLDPNRGAILCCGG